MRIHINLDTETIISGPGSNEPLNNLSFKRDSSARIEVRFYKLGVPFSMPSGVTGIFEIKAKSDYDSQPLVRAITWDRVVEFGIAYYVFSPVFNTVRLNTLLGHGDLDFGNAIQEVSGMLEIEWTQDGEKYKTQTVQTFIQNDVIKDGDQVQVGVDSAPLDLNDFPISAIQGSAPSVEIDVSGVFSTDLLLEFSIGVASENVTVEFAVILAEGDSAGTIRAKIVSQCNAAFANSGKFLFEDIGSGVNCRLLYNVSSVLAVVNSSRLTFVISAAGVDDTLGTPAEFRGQLAYVSGLHVFMCVNLSPLRWRPLTILVPEYLDFLVDPTPSGLYREIVYDRFTSLLYAN
jgi:hypothetical protein